MQIQKYNGYQSPNFGTAVTIKTDDLEVASKLVQLGELFHKQAHPKFRYMPRGHEMGPKGLCRGVMGDGDHKEVIEGFQSLSLGNRLRVQVEIAIKR